MKAIKEFWKDNKDKIIFGAKCVAVSFGIGFNCAAIGFGNGFIKGMKYESSSYASVINRLLDEKQDPAAFLSSIEDDDYILDELRNRMYNEIKVPYGDHLTGVVDVMKDVLDNHWREDGYER